MNSLLKIYANLVLFCSFWFLLGFFWLTFIVVMNNLSSNPVTLQNIFDSTDWLIFLVSTWVITFVVYAPAVRSGMLKVTFEDPNYKMTNCHSCGKKIIDWYNGGNFYMNSLTLKNQKEIAKLNKRERENYLTKLLNFKHKINLQINQLEE